MTTKEPKNTDKDWGAPEKLPLKRRMQRWLGVVAFIVAVHLVLAYLFSIPLVRHYAFIGRIIYDSTIGQVWREATQDRNRDITFPNSSYKTYRSGYGLWGGKENRAFWINDQEFIFNGRFSKILPNADPFIPDILIWNIEQGVRVFRRQAWLNCFFQGHILFNTGTVDSYYYGTLENNQKIGRLEEAPKNVRNCDREIYERSALATTNDSRLLHPEDGWLEFSTSSEVPPHIVHHKENGEVVRLDLGIANEPRVYNRFHVQYAEFKKAYFLYSDYAINKTGTNWPRTLDQAMWWFYPEGRVEKLLVPAPWGVGYSYHPSAKGIIVSTTDLTTPKRFDSVFLIDGNVVSPILAENTSAIGIIASPSGCRVAMSVANAKPPFGGLGLYVVELCPNPDGEKDAR